MLLSIQVSSLFSKLELTFRVMKKLSLIDKKLIQERISLKPKISREMSQKELET